MSLARSQGERSRIASLGNGGAIIAGPSEMHGVVLSLAQRNIEAYNL